MWHRSHNVTFAQLLQSTDGYVPDLDRRERKVRDPDAPQSDLNRDEPETRYQKPARSTLEILEAAYGKSED